MTWSRPRTIRLEELVAQGLTASEIADLMRITRNQVVGKAWRLGLSIGAGQPRGERTARGREYHKHRPPVDCRALSQQGVA